MNPYRGPDPATQTIVQLRDEVTELRLADLRRSRESSVVKIATASSLLTGIIAGAIALDWGLAPTIAALGLFGGLWGGIKMLVQLDNGKTESSGPR